MTRFFRARTKHNDACFDVYKRFAGHGTHDGQSILVMFLFGFQALIHSHICDRRHCRDNFFHHWKTSHAHGIISRRKNVAGQLLGSLAWGRWCMADRLILGWFRSTKCHTKHCDSSKSLAGFLHGQERLGAQLAEFSQQHPASGSSPLALLWAPAERRDSWLTTPPSQSKSFFILCYREGFEPKQARSVSGAFLNLRSKTTKGNLR